MSVHVFGIRHHGPGSARSLLASLQKLKPDAVLIEGPPDADHIIPMAADPGLKPPVAILIFDVERPRRAVYYPFAQFSPEWQALRYAADAGVAARFIDLPMAFRIGQDEDKEEKEEKEEPEADGEHESIPTAARDSMHGDPVRWLAEAAGDPDPERWWERMVEQRGSSEGVFEGIAEAMGALREAWKPPGDWEERREAHMRQAIRAAVHEGHERIAVICGAWHAPALQHMPTAAADAKTLRGLKAVKVEATWIPWTHGRLALESGYGAGVESPGWYNHLWTHPTDPLPVWMTRVVRLMRDQDLDASPAQAIDAMRLAETLTALRGRAAPTLDEVTEAVQASICFGSDVPVRLIRERLIIGDELGELPPHAPAVPLQRDLEHQQRVLRLKAEPLERVLDLDLRNPGRLAVSHLLHRLLLLDIQWGIPQQGGMSKGTFHEVWKLQWRPEFALAVIEAGVWGNSVAAAATARTVDHAGKATDLAEVASLLDEVVLAELPEAAEAVIARLKERATLTTDLAQMMGALAPLASTLRYGSVRKTDADLLGAVVAGLVNRVSDGLVGGTRDVDDDSAKQLAQLLLDVNRALTVLGHDEWLVPWRKALEQLGARGDRHGQVVGRACRLLLDAGNLEAGECSRRLGLALSRGTDPMQAGAWVEGFLEGSGLILLTDDQLWQVLDGWISAIRTEDFTALLPVLRRTFSTFPAGERRQIGERAARGVVQARREDDEAIDQARAAIVEPVLRVLLGDIDG